MKKILLLEICLLFLATNFQSDNPPGWYQQTLPVNKFITDIYFVDTLTGWAVTNWDPQFDTAYILHTTNGGDNWNIQLQQPVSFNVMSFPSDSIGYAGGGDGFPKLYKTTNQGINWNQISSPPTKRVLDMQFVNNDTGWICDDDPLFGGLHKTTNGGISWVQQLGPSIVPNRMSFINADTGWMINTEPSGKLYRTNNGGINWILQYTHSSGISDVYFFNDLTGILTSNVNQRTTNGGFTWIASNDGGGKISMGTDSVGWAGRLFSRIVKTTDQGETWNLQTSPIFNNSSLFAITENICFAGGTGIVKTTDGGATSISQISNEIPSEYELYQNYPNPFNPSTTIEFELLKTSDVSLQIFDVSGKLIGGVGYTDKIPGRYRYDHNADGSTSGIYFYRLLVDGITIDTKKMMYVK